MRDISSEEFSNLFSQISLHTQEINSSDRLITNLGIGYRQLNDDKSSMFGINSFIDYDLEGHTRGSVGFELKGATLDLTANSYHKLTNMEVVDGTEEQVIQASLRIEIDSLKARHHNVQDIFKKMAAYAPAFGMIGTLIGLVQMLANISDPKKIGPAMAVALLTTFYGSCLANLVFTPCAGKLKARTVLEVLNLEIVFEGAAAILDNNNPMTVYERLSSYIPASKRKPMKRRGGGDGEE